jgi:hypothetical protein
MVEEDGPVLIALRGIGVLHSDDGFYQFAVLIPSSVNQASN